jgi:hypothetical protein
LSFLYITVTKYEVVFFPSIHRSLLLGKNDLVQHLNGVSRLALVLATLIGCGALPVSFLGNVIVIKHE